MLQSCGDLFSTAEVSPKPESLHHYGTLLKKTGETEYLMTEMLVGRGGAETERVLSRKKITFQFQQDSVGENGDSLFIFRMSVSDFNTGEIDMETLFLAKFEESSIQYALPQKEEGPRFFLLKTSAVQADSLSGDLHFFQALPSHLFNQLQWTKTRADFTFDRKIIKLDTIIYRNKLEETWLVRENVTFGSQHIMSGSFWYGKSGMLKSVQTWDKFDYRNTLGKSLGYYKIERSFNLIAG